MCAIKPRLPTGSVHLTTAELLPHVYCLEMIDGGQGTEKETNTDMAVD